MKNKFKITPHPNKDNTLQLFIDGNYVTEERVSYNMYSLFKEEEIKGEKRTIYDDLPAREKSPVPKQNLKAVPSEFEFDSKLIFLSNMDTIPESLGDKILAVQVNFSREKALYLIDSYIEKIGAELPSITTEDKKRILSFIEENIDIDKINYDIFLRVSTCYASGYPKWKEWALAQEEVTD